MFARLCRCESRRPSGATRYLGQRVREAVGVAPGQAARDGRLRYCPAPAGLFFSAANRSNRMLADECLRLCNPTLHVTSLRQVA
jgi:hypothetical protein